MRDTSGTPWRAQPVVVVLEVFDEVLEVADAVAEACRLEQQPIVPERSMTQQGLCHTNSDGTLRSWRRVMDGRSPQNRAAGATPESHRRRRRSTGAPALPSALGEAPHVLARAPYCTVQR